MTKRERDFMDAISRFREYMGQTKWDGEQRRSGFRLVTLAYVNLGDEADERLANLYLAVAREYDRRMELLGYDTE